MNEKQNEISLVSFKVLKPMRKEPSAKQTLHQQKSMTQIQPLRRLVEDADFERN